MQAQPPPEEEGTPEDVEEVKAFSASGPTSRTSIEMVGMAPQSAAAPQVEALRVTIPNAIPSNGSGTAADKASLAAPVNSGKATDADNGTKKKEEPYKVPFKRLLGYAKGRYSSVFLGCIASVAGGSQHPAFAFVMASMIGIFYTSTPVRVLYTICSALACRDHV